MKNRFSGKTRYLHILVLVLACTWGFAAMFPSQLPAQADIDDVISGLENDFDLGSGKNDVKRSNLESTNEQNREDIKIEEEEQRQKQQEEPEVPMVTLTLDIQEINGSPLQVELMGGGILASGVSNNLVSKSFQLLPGITHSLTVTCSGCGYWLFFTKGAVFSNPSNAFDGCFGGSITLEFQVDADDNEPTNVNPGPPGGGGC